MEEDFHQGWPFLHSPSIPPQLGEQCDGAPFQRLYPLDGASADHQERESLPLPLPPPTPPPTLHPEPSTLNLGPYTLNLEPGDQRTLAPRPHT